VAKVPTVLPIYRGFHLCNKTFVINFKNSFCGDEEVLGRDSGENWLSIPYIYDMMYAREKIKDSGIF
jgi:hypothetical protein